MGITFTQSKINKWSYYDLIPQRRWDREQYEELGEEPFEHLDEEKEDKQNEEEEIQQDEEAEQDLNDKKVADGTCDLPTTYARSVGVCIRLQCLLTVDDIVIYSSDWSSHVCYLRIVFQCLHKHV